MNHEPLRRDLILEFLQLNTSASIENLAAKFQASEMTIRRDLKHLSEANAIVRIPGGAMIAKPLSFEKTFQERLQKMAEAKNSIGRMAAELVKEGEAVVLESGTTTLYIARHLRSHRNIIVLTYSLGILAELVSCDSVRVEFIGGTYRRASHDLVGPQVSAGLSRVSANKVFFGAAGLSFQKGVMQYDLEMPRELLQSGAERILVVDSSKIGHDALYTFCPVESCSRVITDSGISREHLARLQKMVHVDVVQ